MSFNPCHNESPVKRRDALKSSGAASIFPRISIASELAGTPIATELSIVSANTVRFSIHESNAPAAASDGALVKESWSSPAKIERSQTIKSGDLRIIVDPLALKIETGSKLVQHVKVDQSSGAISFLRGDAPLLALGEGGPQFDRRGSTDRMRSGQGGYQLRTHGGRVPIPWLIGTSGWAIFFHQPLGPFDFTNAEAVLKSAGAPLPIDLFVVASQDPKTIMAEYARLTGLPELPPLWSFGYRQSHRTLASREEILEEARTFRDAAIGWESR